MPTYQYSCTDCGHFFEAVQSFSDDSLTTCPECQGKLRKVFNAVGVVFKGSGFYRNDSRSGGANGGSSNGSNGSSSSSTNGSKSSEGSSSSATTTKETSSSSAGSGTSSTGSSGSSSD